MRAKDQEDEGFHLFGKRLFEWTKNEYHYPNLAIFWWALCNKKLNGAKNNTMSENNGKSQME